MTERRVAVLTVKSSSEPGGAERFFEGLVAGLRGWGVTAERVEFDESSFETIEESYLRFYDQNLSSYDGVISTKAPSYAARHRTTSAISCTRCGCSTTCSSMSTQTRRSGNGYNQIHRMDTSALGKGRIKALFSIGHEVSARLSRTTGFHRLCCTQASTSNCRDPARTTTPSCPGGSTGGSGWTSSRP